MSLFFVRLLRGAMWLVLAVTVALAIAVTGLRLALPHLNDYRHSVATWLSHETDMAVNFSHLQGKWQFDGPSLTVENVEFGHVFPAHSLVKVRALQVEWDIWQSLKQGRLVLHNVRLDGVRLDLTQFSPNWWSKGAHTTPDHHLANRLNQLLLHQLQRFSIVQSQVILTMPNGEVKTLFVPELFWRNENNRHQAQGRIQVADSPADQLQLMADLTEPDNKLSGLQGEIYLKGQNVSLRPWLAPWIDHSVSIQKADTSFQAWLSLEPGTLGNVLIALDKGQLCWQRAKQQQDIRWQKGVVRLSPIHDHQGWQWSVRHVDAMTNGYAWSSWTATGAWSPQSWQGQISHLSVAKILPLVSLSSVSAKAWSALSQIAPKGDLEQIHISAEKGQTPQFSMQFVNGGMKHWRWLPSMHKLQAQIRGSFTQGQIEWALLQDTLPYGKVFAKPLNITQSHGQLRWKKQGDVWRIFSPNLDVITPDVSVKGQFSLSIPPKRSPLLSLMTQVNVKRVSQVWRYLPRAAMSTQLADYLSQALQGGQVKNGHLLWYGRLSDFPYHDGKGIFQASVPLKNGVFQFDRRWPAVKDLAMTALFENDKLYLNATHGVTEGAVATSIRGQAELSGQGVLDLTANIRAKDGEQVRQYMDKTPLKSSVGKTLAQINVSDPLTAQLHLSIPFGKGDVKAWGSVDLRGNTVALQTPPLVLKQATGQLRFDDAKIDVKDLDARWLSQPVTLNLSGAPQGENYNLSVALGGHWRLSDVPYLPLNALKKHVSGHLPWLAQVDLAFKPKGFTYQGKVNLPMSGVSSQLPYPLHLDVNSGQTWRVDIKGDDRGLQGSIITPNLLYQMQMAFASQGPKIEAMDLQLGKGLTPYHWPLTQSRVAIQCDELDLDQWIHLLSTLWAEKAKQPETAQATSSSSSFSVPLPSEVVAQIGRLKLGDLWWHGVGISAYDQQNLWQAFISSQETQGTVTWQPNKQLNIDLQTAHFSLPPLRRWSLNASVQQSAKASLGAEWITPFDRKVFAAIPSIHLKMKDVWVQGRQVGEIDGVLVHNSNNITLKRLNVTSKDAKLALTGQWQLAGARNYTHFRLHLQGKNSTSLMAMFGVKGGIHDSPFDTHLSLDWAGTPWAIVPASLNGVINTELGEGIISGVGNDATRLLGFFSLDTLIRRLRLDFSDLSEDGFAFDRIKGSAIVQNGIISTQNVTMKAPAGDMSLKGNINLNTEKINAKVTFVPDLASGLPTLAAFAVAPQSALYVLAASTLLAPFIDVFAQIHYSIEGNMFAPTVKEISRDKERYDVSSFLKQTEQNFKTLY